MKKQIIKIIALALITFLCHQAQAQQYTYVDRDGKDIGKYRPTLENISGTPFLIEKWTLGTVTSLKDTTYNNIRLKYDVYNDKLVYANATDDMLVFTEWISKFTLNNMVFANGFPAIDTLSSATFYQIISDGKTKLLKHWAKHIVESKGYGSSMTNYRYDDMQVWYVFKGRKISRIKLDRTSILTALSDKQTELNTYLNSHKVNFKNETDLGALFKYYNSL